MIDWVNDPPPAVAESMISMLRRAAEASPSSRTIRIELAQLLERQARFSESSGIWRALLSESPNDLDVRLKLANALERLGAVDQALASLEGAGDDAALDSMRLRLLAVARRWDDAARLIEEKGDDHFRAGAMLKYLSARPGEPDPAAVLALAGRILATHPGNAGVIYQQAVALAKLGRMVEARDTIGADRFVEVRQLPHDQGAAFNTALCGEILRNDTLRPDPPENATRQGRQSRVLVRQGDAATPALCEHIRSAVDDYAARLAGNHPFVRGRPARATLEAWAVVYGKDGHQGPHRHPSGWLSGVYFVSGDGASPAPLRIGVPDENGVDTCEKEQQVMPLPGRIVLFPSAVTHATVPASSADTRIVVAFDVVAVP